MGDQAATRSSLQSARIRAADRMKFNDDLIDVVEGQVE
jgi:hypothetical protein